MKMPVNRMLRMTRRAIQVLTGLTAAVIGGDAEPDAVLDTVTAATWSEAVTLTYQWYRGGDPIAGATSETYTVTDEDVGLFLRRRDTGTAGAESVSQVSNLIGPIAFRLARYWGVRFNAGNTPGGALAMGDLGFFDAFGGDSLVSNLNAVSTGTSPADEGAGGNAFDGRIGRTAILGYNKTNFVFTHPFAGEKVYADLGGDTEVRVLQIVAAENALVGNAPKDFDIVSCALGLDPTDDGNWTTVRAFTGETGWEAGEVRYYFVPGASMSHTGSAWGPHLTWGVFVCDRSGAELVTSIAEIEMAATPGGADQLTGGTAGAGSSLSGQDPSLAVDNDASTFWTNALPGVDVVNAGDHWQYTKAAPWSVAEVRVKARTGSPGQAPRTVVVWFSDDGAVTRTIAWSGSDMTTMTSGETRTYTDPNYVP